MSTPLLTTKLYIPPPLPNLVRRPHLIEQLDRGLHRKLTLISAPAGFGKTTLVSEWIASRQERQEQGVAWLALDEGDSDPTRFLAYLVAALQTVAPTVGRSILGALHSAQPPPPETILTTLLNDIVTLPSTGAGPGIILVLDDYHVLDSDVVDQALAFLIEYLPPLLHLIITTREDPLLPLARLRARAQLTEVRADALRFTLAEVADFLNPVMGLHLTAQEIVALEARTEGWIAGLQLAAVSIQGHRRADGDDPSHHDIAAFIQSFTGSHRFVMDYLMEEVLEQQPQPLQQFLLYTSILDRFCDPLCDALLCDQTAAGQATLAALEQANLFIVPLDNERRWYRYHHLFGELLRQRLHQKIDESDTGGPGIADLHIRASQWYEEHELELEAFHHATLAQDVGRAERLVEGKGMPLHFRGIIRPVLKWLDTLPPPILDAHPSLWLAHASTLLATGQVARTEEALHAAGRLLQAKADDAGLAEKDRDLIGRIAAIRATIAAGLQQTDVIIAESRRALKYLLPDNLAFRTSSDWKLGYAYHLNGDYSAAKQAYQGAISRSQATGNTIFAIMSHIGLADIYQVEAQLPLAAEHYHRALALSGEQPLPSVGEAHSGLAQIYYEWNELARARRHAEQGLHLGRQWERSDSPIRNEWMLARVQLATGDTTGATVQLTKTITFMRQSHFTRQLDDVVATQVLALLAQRDIEQAAILVQEHDAPLSRARIALAQGDTSKALTLVAAAQQVVAAQGRQDRILAVMALRVVVLAAAGQTEQAQLLLGETLALAEPGGWIRLFVDAGPAMARLLTQVAPHAARHGVTPAYVATLLAAFPAKGAHGADDAPSPAAPHSDQPLPEPLSERESEVLHLIAAGHKNQEIADELVVSLNTVRYHTKNLYGKLGVNKRTQAVAKAQALGLL